MRGEWLYISRLTDYTLFNPQAKADTHSEVVTLEGNSLNMIAFRRDLSANYFHVR